MKAFGTSLRDLIKPEMTRWLNTVVIVLMETAIEESEKRNGKVD